MILEIRITNTNTNTTIISYVETDTSNHKKLIERANKINNNSSINFRIKIEKHILSSFDRVYGILFDILYKIS